MPKIQDYAVIGDGRSAALVSRQGSIDWLCWPRFDSPSIFAALLDERDGGSFRVAPAGPARVSRRYVDDTNVLETRFETQGGVLVVTDFMPIASEEEKRELLMPECELVRYVRCESGGLEVDVLYAPAPDYARAAASIQALGPLGFRVGIGARLFTLRSDAKLIRLDAGRVGARLWLRAGETRTFSLTYHEAGPAVLPPFGPATSERLVRSLRWWRAWANRAAYYGPYRREVVRSALALKLLSYAPSGAIIAAPTTSLPERPGGDLNWDYRFCWLRDASLTARALFGLGYVEEAEAFVSWMLHATRLTRPEVRVLYDVYGRPAPKERELPHLAGYADSRPVRIGNAAAAQTQLDTYGEVIDAAAQLARRRKKLDHETQEMLVELGDYVCRHWREPDSGIWEVREYLRHYTYSLVMCWTALDRLLELHRLGLIRRMPKGAFTATRDLIRAEVESRGWSAELESYTQALDGDSLDASALRFAWYGFDSAASPRMTKTGERIRQRLGAGRGLLYRYEQSLAAAEGAFGICSFWLCEFLARGGGSLSEARAAFEEMLPYANDVGLYAEEIDPATGDAVGNFPQAFTHVGLINAALSLGERAAAEGVDDQARAVPSAKVVP